jgi:hypothetical protein
MELILKRLAHTFSTGTRVLLEKYWLVGVFTEFLYLPDIILFLLQGGNFYVKIRFT